MTTPRQRRRCRRWNDAPNEDHVWPVQGLSGGRAAIHVTSASTAPIDRGTTKMQTGDSDTDVLSTCGHGTGPFMNMACSGSTA